MYESEHSSQENSREVHTNDIEPEYMTLLKLMNVPLDSVKFYIKIIYKGTLYGTAKRSKTIKTNDACILLKDGLYGSIKSIFLHENQYKCIINLYSPLIPCSIESKLCNQIVSLAASATVKIINFNEVKIKCFEIVENNKILIIEPPNNFEKD